MLAFLRCSVLCVSLLWGGAHVGWRWFSPNEAATKKRSPAELALAKAGGVEESLAAGAGLEDVFCEELALAQLEGGSSRCDRF